MRIAYILSPYSYYANVFSGVVLQAKSWASALNALSHEVDFPRPEQPIDWRSYDAVHLFQHGPWCGPLLVDLAQAGVASVYSPIIDPPRPYGLLANIVSHVPWEVLRLQQNQRLLRIYARASNLFLSRSHLETTSLAAVGVPLDKILRVPLMLAKTWQVDESFLMGHRRGRHVFHVSHLCHPRKNVLALLDAAVDLGFELRLAGSISDPAFAETLNRIIKNHTNISYLGQLTDERLQAEMLECAVFCLPSLFEGVGLVALEAAYCGANLVVTSAGGTRDYLGSHAAYVDPSDKAGLRAALASALSLKGPNLAVHRHVAANFSALAVGRHLEGAYRDISPRAYPIAGSVEGSG